MSAPRQLPPRLSALSGYRIALRQALRYHQPVATLRSRSRKQLRDTAFAYVDSHGRRRLPIHDAAHVRNALARFNQVLFEDEAARNTARTRLLRAARKYGIVPIGFIDGQLRAQGPASLPTGAVTFLLTDIQDSTGLVHRLGDGWASVLNDTRRILRAAIRREGGREIDARADEFFAVFKRAPSAVHAAIAIQRGLRDHVWPQDARVLVRAGIHSGRPTLTDSGYVGLAVHATSRISALAHGGQIVLSHAAVRAMGPETLADIVLVELGTHRLRGLPEPETIFQVSVDDLPGSFPALRVPVAVDSNR
jgi:class 3 adenylate cyclase